MQVHLSAEKEKNHVLLKKKNLMESGVESHVKQTVSRLGSNESFR